MVYGMWESRRKRGGPHGHGLKKDKLLHFMMIFLHHRHTTPQPISFFLLVLLPFCACECVMKGTGSTVAGIIWIKRSITAQVCKLNLNEQKNFSLFGADLLLASCYCKLKDLKK
jgi:hypothetical protein